MMRKASTAPAYSAALAKACGADKAFKQPFLRQA